MNKKINNQYQFNKLEQINNQYKYLYLFRIKDLNSKKIIQIKKKLVETDFFFFLIKQKLIQKKFNQIKGQSSLMLLYNNDINLKNLFLILKKKELELIQIKTKNQLISNYKLKTIEPYQKNYLNIQLNKNIFSLFYFLKEITKK